MKDADSVKNVLRVLSIQGFERCLIVVSAMGKTTNALERVVEFYFNKSDYQQDFLMKTTMFSAKSNCFLMI